MKTKLELSLVSHPHHVLQVGFVPVVPARGDFVQRDESGWSGYVYNRRFEYSSDGSVCVVRVWLQKDPPR